jgi:hypothetical protein
MTSNDRTWALDDLRREFQRYSDLVNTSDLAPSTKTTYLVHADRFVRWLAGEVEIGSGPTLRPSTSRTHRPHAGVEPIRGQTDERRAA